MDCGEEHGMKKIVVSKVIEYIRLCNEEEVPDMIADMLHKISAGSVTPSRQRLFRIEVEDHDESQ
jgi:hypothetical protein